MLRTLFWKDSNRLGGAGDRVLAVFDAVDETLRQIYPGSHDEADLEQPTSGGR